MQVRPSAALFTVLMITTAVQRSLQVCEKPQHYGGYYGNHFGSFSSPNYPSPYPNNQKCVWMIKVPLSYRIRLQFSAFHVEACSEGGRSCTCDGVDVYDGQLSVSTKLGRFCGHELPNATDSSGRHMRVELVSDLGGVESQGFAASYVSIAPDGSLFSYGDATVTPRPTVESESGNDTVIIATLCAIAGVVLIGLIILLLIRKSTNRTSGRQETSASAPRPSRPAPLKPHAHASDPPSYSAAVLAPSSGPPPPAYDDEIVA